MTFATQTIRKRGRPRSTIARDSVLRATVSLVNQLGYGPLTMEGIASEAGVSKQTLYRWWPTKGAVIMEALLGEAHDLLEDGGDRGTLRAELEMFLRQMLTVLIGSTAGMMRGLMAEAQRDLTFAAAFHAKFVTRRRGLVIAIFERARKRGEISREADFELLADLTLGPVWYRVLTGQQQLDEAFVHDLTTMLVRAAGTVT